ncbi:MAG: hypothetical protein WBM08_07985 [Prochlorococcaceae cyanobacterium]
MELSAASSALEVAAALDAALRQWQAGDWAAAEEGLEAVLRARPHLMKLEADLARLRLEQGAAERAERQLRQRLAFFPPQATAADRELLEEVLIEARQALIQKRLETSGSGLALKEGSAPADDWLVAAAAELDRFSLLLDQLEAETRDPATGTSAAPVVRASGLASPTDVPPAS